MPECKDCSAALQAIHYHAEVFIDKRGGAEHWVRPRVCLLCPTCDEATIAQQVKARARDHA